ncbi:unnamed protein product [Cylindrotheca closterium]|uniref:HSF-type DNA-binding domain-containing protein n=1 Tax=Cylindrotheca closterium TaxID=2856 RepID=A0AAD2G148_9STRA|nr:unnamed protein product [Cylindrotheca closterium]
MPAFPYKLHELLDDVNDDAELSAIISWLPEGTSFRIHSYEQFEKRLLKQYFPRQTQIKSFMRQLQYYDFENFGGGLFSHPCFKRGLRNKCGQILHQLPTKSQKANGGRTRPLKSRGRKKRIRASSFASTAGTSSGSVLTTTAGDASVISHDSSESFKGGVTAADSKHDSSPTLSPTKAKQADSITRGPFAAELGDTMSLAMPPAVQSMISQQQQILMMHQQQTLAQFQQMQAMQMARQKYLSCLQQEMLLESLFRNGSNGHSIMSSSNQAIPHQVFQPDTTISSASGGNKRQQG